MSVRAPRPRSRAAKFLLQRLRVRTPRARIHKTLKCGKARFERRRCRTLRRAKGRRPSQTLSRKVLLRHWTGFQIPLQNLLAGPIEHAIEAADVFIDGFEIFDAVRLPADIGMDGNRKDLCALFSFGIKPLELIE